MGGGRERKRKRERGREREREIPRFHFKHNMAMHFCNTASPTKKISATV
jgi:hypothetical protein